MDHFDLLLNRVLQRRGARRRENIRHLKRLHFVASTKDENTKAELRQELVNSNRDLIECEEENNKLKQTLFRERNISDILRTDLDQLRKLRKRDKDSKEKAEKELRELKEKLSALSQSS